MVKDSLKPQKTVKWAIEMSLTVDEPILNNPFEEPKGNWGYEEGQPKRL